MKGYPEDAWERAMKVQEVILRALAKRIIPRGGTSGGDFGDLGPEYAPLVPPCGTTSSTAAMGSLTGDAASHLVERGFNRQIGLTSCKPVGGTSYEQFVSEDFAPSFLNPDEQVGVFAGKYSLDLMEGTIAVARMYEAAASFSVPGMVLFENSLGGRFGVVPLSGVQGDLYAMESRGWKRQYDLKKMLESINRGPVPLFVEGAANVLPLRRDGEKAVLIGVANLSADPMPEVELQLAPPFEGKPAVQWLTLEGKRKPVDAEALLAGGYWHVRIPVRVAPVGLACFRLTKA
jgi:hypothetical protein